MRKLSMMSKRSGTLKSNKADVDLDEEQQAVEEERIAKKAKQKLIKKMKERE